MYHSQSTETSPSGVFWLANTMAPMKWQSWSSFGLWVLVVFAVLSFFLRHLAGFLDATSTYYWGIFNLVFLLQGAPRLLETRPQQITALYAAVHLTASPTSPHLRHRSALNVDILPGSCKIRWRTAIGLTGSPLLLTSDFCLIRLLETMKTGKSHFGAWYSLISMSP